jgi:hypothetical protein
LCIKVLRYLAVGVTAAIVCAGLGFPLKASDDVVLRWNAAVLQAIRNTRAAPPVVARALAIVHTCMYDAWAAYDPIAVGTRFGGGLRRPPSEHNMANKEKALSYSAYRALTDLFPTERAGLFDPLMKALGYDPLDMSASVLTATGIGNTTSRAVLDFRHSDGSNQLGDLSPGAYSDYTGYQPVNDADILRDPNRWQPVRIHNGTNFVVPKFLTPHWGRVIPFALRDGSMLLPPAPAQYPHGSYVAQAKHVLHLNAHLTDRQKMISEYWSDGPSSETPPGHWNLLAQWVSHRDRLTLDANVVLFFALRYCASNRTDTVDPSEF